MWCTKKWYSNEKLCFLATLKEIEILPHFEIMVNEIPLQRATQYKYLGMSLNNQLNYNLHVQKIILHVTVKLKQFRRMRYFTDDKSALLVHKNMIFPMIEYGDLFLAGTSIENRKKLQILQNKGFKPIFHQNAKYLASGTFASPNAKGSTSASPNSRIPTCWYILALPPTPIPDANPKICVTPDANPRRQSVEYRWRWAFWRWGWRWACTFHVVYVNFICVGHPTQTSFSVEYGL